MNLFGLNKKKSKQRSLDIADLILKEESKYGQQSNVDLTDKEFAIEMRKISPSQMVGGFLRLVRTLPDGTRQVALKVEGGYNFVNESEMIKLNERNRNLEAPTQEGKNI